LALTKKNMGKYNMGYKIISLPRKSDKESGNFSEPVVPKKLSEKVMPKQLPESPSALPKSPKVSLVSSVISSVFSYLLSWVPNFIYSPSTETPPSAQKEKPIVVTPVDSQDEFSRPISRKKRLPLASPQKEKPSVVAPHDELARPIRRKKRRPLASPQKVTPSVVTSVGSSDLVTASDTSGDEEFAMKLRYGLSDPEKLAQVEADALFAYELSIKDELATESEKGIKAQIEADRIYALSLEKSPSKTRKTRKPTKPTISAPSVGSVVRNVPGGVNISAHSGLLNVRLDCFANSVVQSVASPKFLANLHALDEEHEGLVAPLDPIQTRRKAYLTETAGARASCIAFVTELIDPTRSMAEIRDLKRAFYTSLPAIGEINFGRGYADADEFVRGLLDGVGLTQPCLRSTLLREDNTEIRHRIDSMAHIQVSIEEIEADTVASAVTSFFARDTLAPDINHPERDGLRHALEAAPDILPVNLKRTAFFRHGNYPRGRNYSRIGSPLKVKKGKGLTAKTEEIGAYYKITKPMTLSPEITVPLASGRTATYRLKAVSCHRPGHYVAAVSYIDTETGHTHWVDHNDSQVSYIGRGEDPGALRASIRSEGYVLIYEKQD
jgi:hypothetical protein